MAVVEQVTLRGVIPSSSEIQELQNTVMRIEDLVERSETATTKIRQSSAERRGGIFASSDTEGSIPKRDRKRELTAPNSRAVDTALANSVKSKDKTSAAAFDRSNAFKEVTNDIDFLKETQKKTQETLSLLQSIQGSIFTNIISKSSRFLPTAFIFTIAVSVFGIIKSQFGAGGIFDIRKLELDAVKSLIGLERETDIIGGDTLFLGNPTLVQGITKNQTSNTDDLRDGQRRFVLRSNGY